MCVCVCVYACCLCRVCVHLCVCMTMCMCVCCVCILVSEYQSVQDKFYHYVCCLGNYDYAYADIDECTEMTDMCDFTCRNTIGSYTCSCDNGYTLLPDGITCQGIYTYMVQKVT